MTYPELVSRLYDLQRLASVPEAGERSGNATSFDRNARYDPATDTYIDWGANADGSGMIRMEGADTVVAELEGPGVIWRVWSAKPEQGHIQVYIDGSDTPALDMPFADYFNNREGMFAYPALVHELSRGQNSYIPIAFAESCKVVMCEGWGMFYQITHTTFAPGTVVPSFSGAFDEATKAALAKANHTLAHRAVQPSTDAAIDQQFVIPGGTSVAVFDAAGDGAITELWAHVHLRGGVPRQVLRELTIAIYWDGEPDPSVWAPLGDFFGSGPGLNRYASLPMGITQDGCYAKWYMPFADGARIVIANDGDDDRTIDFRTASEPLNQPASDLLRVHAKWHGDAFCDRDPERYLKGDRYPDWPMLITTGAGRFCGVNLQVWNPNAFGRAEPRTMADFDGYGENVTKYFDNMNRWWWGEGDEKFFVDGEKFPSTFGTGSEDYFGYAWAASFPQEFSSAFQNLPLCRDNCMGHVSQNRFQIADNVPFGESFEACIEKYHPNHWPLLYHCTAYWYQQAGQSDPYGPVGLAARLPAGVSLKANGDSSVLPDRTNKPSEPIPVPASAPSTGPVKAQRPNILLILNDDMGYSDLGCYGGEIETPNLDRLAAGGLRFTQFYNTARCCPSRASLLTGLHPHQTGIGGMVGGGGGPEGYEGTINDRCVTIAEALRAEGYATAMSGKWHVAGDHENENPCWPNARGFDHHYGIITGAADYYAPRTLKRNGRDVEQEALEDPEYYFTDAISDDAVDCINRHFAEPDPNPLFQYVAYTAPHWPLHAPEKDIARYKGRFADGWDCLREARMNRMVALGVIDPKWALSARDERQPAWEQAEDKEWQQRRMEVYAAQIDVMDQGIGRITAALDAQGQLDNTLILFLADNGGAAEEVSTEWVKQGWMDALSIIQHETKEGKPVRFGNTPDIQPGAQDTYCSYGVPWANLSNTPFRLYKGWIHEGGISTPFIAHWPAGMQAQPGSLHHSPWQLPDVMATVLDVAGAPYPVDYAGRDVKPLEGHSFASVLNGEEAARLAPLFWEHEGNAAVRDGRWKLVRNYPRDSSLRMTDPAAWELYDIDEDRTELHDLAAEAPDRVRTMLDAFLAWAKRASVLDVHELQN